MSSSSSSFKQTVSDLDVVSLVCPPPPFTDLIEKPPGSRAHRDLLTDDDEMECDQEITNITNLNSGRLSPEPIRDELDNLRDNRNLSPQFTELTDSNGRVISNITDEPNGTDLRDGLLIHVDENCGVEFEEFSVEEAIVSTKTVKSNMMVTKTVSSSESFETSSSEQVIEQTSTSKSSAEDNPTTTNDSVSKKKTKKSSTKKQKPEVSKENISVCVGDSLPPGGVDLPKKLGPGESRVFAKVCVANLRRSFGDLTKLESHDANKSTYRNRATGPSSLPSLTNKTNTTKLQLFDPTYWDGLLANSNTIEKSSFSKFDSLAKSSDNQTEKRTTSESEDPSTTPSTPSTAAAPTKPEPKKMYCASCEKQVFQMELIRAEKLDWHKNCFRCVVCRKVLSVDTYQSNNKTVYCKPHFKELFQPKAVVTEDEPPKSLQPRSKLQLIICESQPKELPPDVVRASDTPSTGLEDIQIDVRSKFEMFEGMKEAENQDKSPEPLVVKRSASVLAKLKKYENSLTNGNTELEGVSDEDLHGVDAIELQSDEEELDGESNSVIKDEIKRKLKNPLQALNEIAHFKQMEQVRSKWEEGTFTKEEQRADQRKEELQKFRSRLCQGKSGTLKEMYEKGLDGAATGDSISESRKSEIENLKSERAKAFREMFEKGEIIRRSTDDDEDQEGEEQSGEGVTRRGVDLEVFEAGVARESKRLFEELDKKLVHEKSETNGRAIVSRSKFTNGSASKVFQGLSQPETPTDVVRSSDASGEPIQVNTAELSSKFKFFETYQAESERKAKESKREVFKRITPPREDGVVKTEQDYDTPDGEAAYRDPNVVRSGEAPEDDTLQKSKTTSKMLSVFRQMESSVSNGGSGKDVIIRPLKQFTPPRDTAPCALKSDDSEEEYDNEEPVDDEEDETPQPHDREDDFLKEVGSLARARSLRAKFERWEQQENERNKQAPVSDELAESIESAKNLKAKFEAMRVMESNKENGHQLKVNRFVLNNNHAGSSNSSTSVSPITVSFHSLPADVSSNLIMSGNAEQCALCEKRVYVMEKIEAGGKMYHKNCFRCSQCKCILRMDTFTSNKGTLFCTTHFKQLFKIKGNYDEGFGHETQYQQWAKNKQAQAQQN